MTTHQPRIDLAAPEHVSTDVAEYIKKVAQDCYTAGYTAGIQEAANRVLVGYHVVEPKPSPEPADEPKP